MVTLNQVLILYIWFKKSHSSTASACAFSPLEEYTILIIECFSQHLWLALYRYIVLSAGRCVWTFRGFSDAAAWYCFSWASPCLRSSLPQSPLHSPWIIRSNGMACTCPQKEQLSMDCDCKKEKGEGGGSSSLKLNLTDPCRTWGMPGRRAVSTVSVCASTVQCRELKTGQQRVHFYCEDEIHCRSGYSLSMDCGKWALYSTLHTVLLICTLLRF